jgi:hypothetical protein
MIAMRMASQRCHGHGERMGFVISACAAHRLSQQKRVVASHRNSFRQAWRCFHARCQRRSACTAMRMQQQKSRSCGSFSAVGHEQRCSGFAPLPARHAGFVRSRHGTSRNFYGLSTRIGVCSGADVLCWSQRPVLRCLRAQPLSLPGHVRPQAAPAHCSRRRSSIMWTSNPAPHRNKVRCRASAAWK